MSARYVMVRHIVSGNPQLQSSTNSVDPTEVIPGCEALHLIEEVASDCSWPTIAADFIVYHEIEGPLCAVVVRE